MCTACCRVHQQASDNRNRCRQVHRRRHTRMHRGSWYLHQQVGGAWGSAPAWCRHTVQLEPVRVWRTPHGTCGRCVCARVEVSAALVCVWCTRAPGRARLSRARCRRGGVCLRPFVPPPSSWRTPGPHGWHTTQGAPVQGGQHPRQLWCSPPLCWGLHSRRRRQRRLFARQRTRRTRTVTAPTVSVLWV